MTIRVNRLAIQSKEILEDIDGNRKAEIEVFAGLKNFNETSKRKVDVWLNFYDLAKEIKQINQKVQNHVHEVHNPEVIFRRYLEEIRNSADFFTVDENNGRGIDLHHCFDFLMNDKKLREHYKVKTYLEYLNSFHKMSNIPIEIKKSNDYSAYMILLESYFKEYYTKCNPLEDPELIFEFFINTFNEHWERFKGFLDNPDADQEDENLDFSDLDKIVGEAWIHYIVNLKENSMKYYCIPCEKICTSDFLFNQHKASKAHLKKEKKFLEENTLKCGLDDENLIKVNSNLILGEKH